MPSLSKKSPLPSLLLVAASVCQTCWGQTPEVEANQLDSKRAEQILQRGREYADNYIAKLPDFLCRQRTDQFQGDKKASRWKQGDTIESKLIFAGGREKRTLEAINGKAPNPGMRHVGRRPLTTEGEFGVLLANVLGSGSEAKFQWEGLQNLAGKTVAVFAYNMAREHSTLKLSRSDLAQAVVPYHGKVFIDPASGEVWRISNEADDIPEDLETRSIATVINYQQVAIGTANYLMPSQATVMMTTKSGSIRNELSFRAFQKFETGSTITFGEGGEGGGAASAPPPAPPR